MLRAERKQELHLSLSGPIIMISGHNSLNDFNNRSHWRVTPMIDPWFDAIQVLLMSWGQLHLPPACLDGQLISLLFYSSACNLSPQSNKKDLFTKKNKTSFDKLWLGQ